MAADKGGPPRVRIGPGGTPAEDPADAGAAKVQRFGGENRRELAPGPASPKLSKPAKIGKLASGPSLGPVPSADTETGSGSASVPPGFRRG